jgi:hypothetical protein
MSSNKRQRADSEAVPTRSQFKLAPQLIEKLGKKFCDESELGSLLLAAGLCSCVETIRMKATLLGDSKWMDIDLDVENATAAELKLEVERQSGKPANQQELFQFIEGWQGGSCDQEEDSFLPNDTRFDGPSSVVISINDAVDIVMEAEFSGIDCCYMGLYERLQGETLCGRGVWKKQGEIDMFLYYVKYTCENADEASTEETNGWLISNILGSEVGWMHVESESTTPDGIAEDETWYGVAEGDWCGLTQTVSARVCSSVEKHAAKQKESAALKNELEDATFQAQLAHTIIVTGDDEWDNEIGCLGSYDLIVGKMVNARGVWQNKEGKFLFYTRESISKESSAHPLPLIFPPYEEIATHIHFTEPASVFGQWVISTKAHLEAAESGLIERRVDDGIPQAIAHNTNHQSTPVQLRDAWINPNSGRRVRSLHIDACETTQAFQQALDGAVVQAQAAAVIVCEGSVEPRSSTAAVGIYDVMEGSSMNGRAVWQQRHGNKFLFYNARQSAWQFASERQMDAGSSKCVMASRCTSAITPNQVPAEEWKSFKRVSEGKKWSCEKTLRVRVQTTAEAQQLHRAQEQEQAQAQVQAQQAQEQAQQARMLRVEGLGIKHSLHHMEGIYHLSEIAAINGRAVWEKGGNVILYGLGGWAVADRSAIYGLSATLALAGGIGSVASEVLTPDQVPTQGWETCEGGDDNICDGNTWTQVPELRISVTYTIRRHGLSIPLGAS